MIRICHVSDLHYGKFPRNDGEATRLLTAVYTTYKNLPDHYLMVTGDTVDDGLQKEFDTALRSPLKEFNGRLLIVPGNHDYCIDGTFFPDPGSLKDFDEYFVAKLGVRADYRHRVPNVRVLDDNHGTKVLTVGISTFHNKAAPGLFAKGKVDEVQLQKLDHILADAAYNGMWKVVYMHHRPNGGDIFNDLIDRENVLSVAKKHQVDVLAFGHDGGQDMMHEKPLQIDRLEEKTLLLNANSSVGQRAWFEMTFDGEKMTVLQRQYTR